MMTTPPDPAARGRFFHGCISVQVRRDALNIDQHNELFAAWHRSEDEALGYWSRTIMKKHPGGTIVWQGVYDITELARQGHLKESSDERAGA